MNTFYMFIIGIAVGYANRIEFVNNEACPDVPDFCSCSRVWVKCDCQNGVKTTGNLLGNKRFINIRNCHKLTVPSGSFKSERLTVVFQDIKNLNFSTGCFEAVNNAHMNITILNSTAYELPSRMFSMPMRGGLVSHGSGQPLGVSATPILVFSVVNSKIKKVASGVFANYTLRNVHITNTTIGQIDTEAINNQVKKTISFINNTFTSLAKRAVVLHGTVKGMELQLVGNNFTGSVPQFLVGFIQGDVNMLNNTFPKLHVSPWQLTVEGDILLKWNTFRFLPRHGLDLTVRHRISLVENDIHHLGPEALLHIRPQGKKTIFFMDGNLIHNQKPMSLCLNEDFEPNSVVIKHVKFQQKCDCNISELIQALDIDMPTLSFSQYLRQEIYKNEVHQQWFKNGECLLEAQGISHISIDQFLIYSCLPHNNYTLEILLSTALIIVILAICVTLGWRRMRNTEQTTSADGYHSYTEPLPPSTAAPGWLVVQPEPRTYQETEIHVLFDKAQEIKDDDGEEIFEKEDDKVKNMKRTPSPSTRQSCPVLPSSQSKQ